MKIHSFNVQPNLPEPLKPLREIADNMWFAWNWKVVNLFFKIDEKLWTKARRNPKWFLGSVPQKRFEELAKDQNFLAELEEVKKDFYSYLNSETWFSRNSSDLKGGNALFAYFSMEFGIGEGLPIYSGGLGMLAGDHIKSSSDLGLPLVGVGLFYQKGYVKQQLNRDGWQNEVYPDNDWANMPVERMKDLNGADLNVTVNLAGDELHVGIWRVPVGRNSIYLLDTNLPENKLEYRSITEQLYGGDRENRIRQEVVLGIAGVKALKAMGMNPTVYHINEGHSAFLLCQRVIDLMRERGVTYGEACDIVWSTSVFTTHTPVIAGNEYFDPNLVRKYMEYYAKQLGISWDQFLAMGKETSSSPTYCMTVVALRLAAYNNGVSALHGRVSREMWRHLWETLPVNEVPITSITNGIHSASWGAHEILELYRKYCFNGAFNEHDITDAEKWKGVDNIPNNELWDVHNLRKKKLIDTVRVRVKSQLIRWGADDTVIKKASKILKPEVLTIGFARRFATYKRANLLFRDLERLDRIVNNPDRPVQFVFAGKAHPADTEGKEYIKYIMQVQEDPRFKGKIQFVEDYNMNLARYMVQGVDVWLNNPIRPLEASGTSGMKTALNGALTLSVLDGWWAEVGPCDFSWSIGGNENYKTDAERDSVEAEAIYNTIEFEIAPLFYERNGGGVPEGWVRNMKESIKTIAPFFNTHRMVEEYYKKFYVSAHNYGALLAEGSNLQTVGAWRGRIKQNWYRVSVADISPQSAREIKIGEGKTIKARVSLGAINPGDVSVEAAFGISAIHENADSFIVPLTQTGREGEAYIYEAAFSPENSGRQNYALRVLPKNADVVNPLMPFYIKWED